MFCVFFFLGFSLATAFFLPPYCRGVFAGVGHGVEDVRRKGCFLEGFCCGGLWLGRANSSTDSRRVTGGVGGGAKIGKSHGREGAWTGMGGGYEDSLCQLALRPRFSFPGLLAFRICAGGAVVAGQGRAGQGKWPCGWVVASAWNVRDGMGGGICDYSGVDRDKRRRGRPAGPSGCVVGRGSPQMLATPDGGLQWIEGTCRVSLQR